MKHKTTKPISQRKYLQAPGCCPYCGSDAIEGKSVDIAEGGASQEVNCTDCDAVWIDTYKLAGFSVISGPT